MMPLPNAGRARIDKEKLEGYLLSLEHPRGESKARFFRALGFSEYVLDQFEQALRTVAENGDMAEMEDTSFGVKYVVDGFIVGPNEFEVRLRTVWIIERGRDYPRLVTAYPAPVRGEVL